MKKGTAHLMLWITFLLRNKFSFWYFTLFISAVDLLLLVDFLNCNCVILMRAYVHMGFSRAQIWVEVILVVVTPKSKVISQVWPWLGV
jgi:hypothetical protein